jgi:glycylpeptide N-tetradecanoyltransferase
MPAGFEWRTIDIMDPVEAEEVYVLLRDNYVEDDDCTFRYFPGVLLYCLCSFGS